jgi:hypothetical protein
MRDNTYFNNMHTFTLESCDQIGWQVSFQSRVVIFRPLALHPRGTRCVGGYMDTRTALDNMEK